MKKLAVHAPPFASTCISFSILRNQPKTTDMKTIIQRLAKWHQLKCVRKFARANPKQGNEDNALELKCCPKSSVV